MSRRTPVPIEEWTDPRHVRGAHGEARAAAWLSARGWRVLAARFRVGRHEVDLIVRQGDLVAFVEVKTRSPNRMGDGREAVGWRKRQRLEWVAAAWRARYGRPADRYRFDVITVSVGSPPRVVHLADAWRPTR